MTKMTGMMIAMVVGMMTGLLGGVIVGILLNGQLFFSTVISMGIGMIIGFMLGLPTSVLSVLDGMLSGLMGGMMGAMLGEMIPLKYWDSMIYVMFVLFIGFMLTLIYFIQEETMQKEDKTHLSFIRHPIFLIVTFFIFFYFYSQLGFIVDPSGMNPPSHSLSFYPSYLLKN
ncbi:hypothetical protein WAK64_05950 [Bacillus spongiae]|uniref:Uncharacterized protein n=1 Tax=Bacillus spongiae TaxID=2683610 RepID=A0ABU8HBP3_9BACI